LCGTTLEIGVSFRLVEYDILFIVCSVNFPRTRSWRRSFDGGGVCPTYLDFAFVCFCADPCAQTRMFDILEERLTRPIHDVGSVAVTIIEFDRHFTNCSSASLGLLLVTYA
jgi:hypothetical protein